MKKQSKREHFAHFHIAGFTYNEGALLFDEIRIGKELQMVTEPDNHYDKYAVALYIKDTKLGYIPRSCNRAVSKVLNAGYDIFKAVVQKVDPEAYPEEQVHVIVFIENKVRR